MDAQEEYRRRGERFSAARVADLYRFRPPYSAEVLRVLRELIVDPPRALLDAGAGPGKLARALLADFDRVDAVEPSAAMIAAGRALPGGRHPKLRWIRARLEDAPLDPPYALAVAGASFHWMDPDVVLPKLAEVLAPEGVLALVDGDAPVEAPFEQAIAEVMKETIARAEGKRPDSWLTYRDRLQRPMLEHAHFEPAGVHVTDAWPIEQSIDEFLRCEHSRQSFSEDHLGPELSAFFDDAMRESLSPYATGGRIRYSVRTRIEWGRPV